MVTIFRNYLKLARPKQWVKQILVVFPLITLGTEATFVKFVQIIIAAFIFTLVSISVYFFNDFQDFELDKKDPIKRLRPLAAGLIPRNNAAIGSVSLCFTGLLLSLLFYRYNASLILILYFIINLLYSNFKLKRYGNIGAFLVAIGFALRWAFGSVALSIQFSWWAFVMIIQLALFMLAGKRFQSNKRVAEPNNIQDEHDFWLLSLVIHAAVFIATYTAFVGQTKIQETWTQPALLISLIPIGLGIARYLEIVTHPHKFREGDSTEMMIGDKVLLTLGVIFVGIMFIGRISNG